MILTLPKTESAECVDGWPFKHTLQTRAIGRSYLINHGYTANEVRGLLGNKQKEFRATMLTRLCITFTCIPTDLMMWDGPADSHLNVLNQPIPEDFWKMTQGKTPPEIMEKWRKFLGEDGKHGESGK